MTQDVGYCIQRARGEWEVVTGLEVRAPVAREFARAFNEQGEFDAGLAIGQRAGLTVEPEKWW